MLIADSVTVKGRHDQLVPPTSLHAARGEVRLVVADPQISRTALALALSGRMKPTTGTVSWGHADSLKTLRQHSALLDSPEVNEPESHMKVRDLVAEDLALLPGPVWRKPRAKKWMALHGFDDVAASWADALDPARRLELQLLLAAEDSRVELLVLDSPDRHDMQDEAWLDLLLEFAESHREFAVVATVSDIPYDWDGPVSYLGSTVLEDFEPVAPATQLLGDDTTVQEPVADDALPEGFVQEELDLDLPEAVEQETTTEEDDDLEPTVAEASDVKDER